MRGALNCHGEMLKGGGQAIKDDGEALEVMRGAEG